MNEARLLCARAGLGRVPLSCDSSFKALCRAHRRRANPWIRRCRGARSSCPVTQYPSASSWLFLSLLTNSPRTGTHLRRTISGCEQTARQAARP